VLPLLGAGGSLLSSAGNTAMNLLNRQRQAQWRTEDQYREDTAVQRRVADLRAAGLSPTLAAGSAASTMSSPSPTGENAFNGPNPAESAMAMMTGKANIAQTNAQRQLIRQQKETQKSIKRFTDTQAANQAYNLAWAYDNDLPIGSHSKFSDIKSIFNSFQREGGVLGSAVGSMAENIPSSPEEHKENLENMSEAEKNRRLRAMENRSNESIGDRLKRAYQAVTELPWNIAGGFQEAFQQRKNR